MDKTYKSKNERGLIHQEGKMKIQSGEGELKFVFMINGCPAQCLVG